jgi:membrane-bound hydrogenase subunit alpha
MLYSTGAPPIHRHRERPPDLFARKERPTSTTSYPLGPYHPALFLPIGLSFKLRGETVDSVQSPVTGFGRRGIEGLAAGKPMMDALAIIERACSFAGQSYRLAACESIEAATGALPTRRARLLRSVFAEVERLLARLWMLGMAARAVGMGAAFHEALEQRETLFDAAEQLTGERVYWGIAEPGGVRELRDDVFEALELPLDQLTGAVATWRLATDARGPLGRASAGVGRLARARVTDLGLSGLAALGAGVVDDPRREKLYAGYSDVTFDWADGQTGDAAGDAASRFVAGVADMALSLRLARSLLNALRDEGDDAGATAVVSGSIVSGGGASGEGATVLGPHGPITCRASLAEGDRLATIALERPYVAATLAALPEALRGAPVRLAPLILTSLDLCLECTDL